MHLKRHMFRLNTIPSATMADIAFLLIIFFMLATSFSQDRITVELANSQFRTDVPAKAITLSLDQHNRLYWNGESVDFGGFAGRIRQELALNKYQPFIIRSDRNVRFQVLDQLLQILSDSGVINLSLTTKAEPQKSIEK
ncbi:biopolymer transporter ExbD [bacterium]|nr:biopolymer transporter ExbD [bacterium]